MAYEETYRSDPQAGFPGMIADMSPATIISRTVKTAPLKFGALAAPGSADHTCRPIAAQTFTASQAADAGNTGNGAMTLADPATGAGVMAGRYRVVLIEPASNAGAFIIEDPNGAEIGRGTVAVAYDGVIKFTIADGGTDFVAGDAFSVDVAESTDEQLDDDLGFAVRNQGVRNAGTADQYEIGETAAILVRGPAIWVVAGGNVEPRGPVYFTISTGRYAHTGDIEVKGAKFETTGSNGSVVKVARR